MHQDDRPEGIARLLHDGTQLHSAGSAGELVSPPRSTGTGRLATVAPRCHGFDASNYGGSMTPGRAMHLDTHQLHAMVEAEREAGRAGPRGRATVDAHQGAMAANRVQ
jgi:hypothetical protein